MRLAGAALLALIGLTGGVARADSLPAQLRYHFVAGQRLAYAASVTQGQKPTGKITTTVRLTVETRQVFADGSAERHLVLDGMTMSGAPNDQVDALIRGAVGQEVVVVEDARGRVRSRRIPTDATAFVSAVLANVSQLFGQMTPILPDGPATVHGSWKDDETIQTPGAFDLRADETMELESLRGEVAVVDETVATTVPPGSHAFGATFSGAGFMTTTTTIDLARGATTSGLAVGTMDLETTSPGVADPIQTHTEIRSTFSLLPQTP